MRPASVPRLTSTCSGLIIPAILAPPVMLRHCHISLQRNEPGHGLGTGSSNPHLRRKMSTQAQPDADPVALLIEARQAARTGQGETLRVAAGLTQGELARAAGLS